MNNSHLDDSRRGTLAYMAPAQGTHSGGPAYRPERPERQARIRFLMESAAYLDLKVGRDELIRRFMWQPAGNRATGHG
ncbi:MAG TPA: hypothetical protein VM011_06395 [Gammaproteobacteria bacterium]|nr:hypothetical protein [Gammaproteobacteria bacterium]